MINKIHIDKFRGFKDIEFELGKNLTVIAGQNGTQKTTILGLLSQPFSITNKSNPIAKEKPLCGGNYKSGFSEKFKLSTKFDKPKGHSWTLYTQDTENPKFTVESIKRDKNSIRFWKKGTKEKGSGYLQYPVIYLSLSRLFPLGEDENINTSTSIKLTEDENKLLSKWHKKILIIPGLNIDSWDYLESKQKNTIGVNTDYYDWKTNSAGQDNIGRILLAILSFKRLKEKHPDHYNKGILVIDEIDATLYPASQIKLLEFLRKFSSNYNMQIIFTTHSLTLLKEACDLERNEKLNGQLKVIYLQRVDKTIEVTKSPSYNFIRNKLNVTISKTGKPPKIKVFTEDKEGKIFLKGLLKNKRTKKLDFLKCTMGCDNYLELVRKKIEGFNFPESIICLDGDVRDDSNKLKKTKKFKNIILLPGKKSPERIMAEMLSNEPESSEVWDKLSEGYNKQICFRDIDNDEIQENRKKAKDWFNSQKQYWGGNQYCSKLINIWIKKNREKYDDFIQEFDNFVEDFKK